MSKDKDADLDDEIVEAIRTGYVTREALEAKLHGRDRAQLDASLKRLEAAGKIEVAHPLTPVIRLKQGL